jgi:hypothetical protein
MQSDSSMEKRNNVRKCRTAAMFYNAPEKNENYLSTVQRPLHVDSALLHTCKPLSVLPWAL